MKTSDDIESYLIEMDSNYNLVGQNIWVIKDTGPDLVISIAGPVLVFRVKVMDEAQVKENRESLFRTLLELNATEMLHGSYGIEEGAIVMTSALELENLDFNEFQASIEDMSLAVTKHYPILSRYVEAA
ncbi:MAG: hypothetical protein KC503_14700 [Myxococcales bacterium]|nr:hypothetical protein [Myxococcales bacterium]